MQIIVGETVQSLVYEVNLSAAIGKANLFQCLLHILWIKYGSEEYLKLALETKEAALLGPTLAV